MYIYKLYIIDIKNYEKSSGYLYLIGKSIRITHKILLFL